MEKQKSTEQKIFRDVFNLLEKDDLSTFTEDAKIITSKYTNLDEMMLCTDLISAISTYMKNKTIK